MHRLMWWTTKTWARCEGGEGRVPGVQARQAAASRFYPHVPVTRYRTIGAACFVFVEQQLSVEQMVCDVF